jgi:hypothetical protein
MACNLEVICPALSAFEAKQIRVDGFSLPATWTGNIKQDLLSIETKEEYNQHKQKKKN